MTDANSTNGIIAAIDDNACIDNMIKMLEEGVKSLPLGYIGVNILHLSKGLYFFLKYKSGASFKVII